MPAIIISLSLATAALLIAFIVKAPTARIKRELASMKSWANGLQVNPLFGRVPNEHKVLLREAYEFAATLTANGKAKRSELQEALTALTKACRTVSPYVVVDYAEDDDSVLAV
ncbi:MAG: hypothetical protein K2Y32_05915 [Candidatus Obscuribacterales bacterium]|nr:hypothetical protein [Candidatus Obscuribacterales bacterium]